MILLIKLIAAHLVGDFYLQSDKMCESKYKTIDNSEVWDGEGAVIGHSLIQAIVTFIFLWNWDFKEGYAFLPPLLVFISHGIIDSIKAGTDKRGIVAFSIDQLAHYAALIGIWLLMLHLYDVEIHRYNTRDLIDLIHEINTHDLTNLIWVYGTSYLAILAPTSIMIKIFMKSENWVPEDATTKGMPNAGKWIGYLERILILTFIYTDNIAGIGFLLAAKSVFRIGELNRTKDLKVTEYVLLGTFASFTVAILIGFLVKFLLNWNQ